MRSAPDLRRGRPDIASHIADCVTTCGPDERIGVGACGPAKMLDMTRKALSHSTYDNGPSIDFHTEVGGFDVIIRRIRTDTLPRLGIRVVILQER